MTLTEFQSRLVQVPAVSPGVAMRMCPVCGATIHLIAIAETGKTTFDSVETHFAFHQRLDDMRAAVYNEIIPGAHIPRVPGRRF